jgi:hypothetical protein
MAIPVIFAILAASDPALERRSSGDGGAGFYRMAPGNASLPITNEEPIRWT